MTREKWFKVTAIILVAITVLLIAYDIFIVLTSSNATISGVIKNTSYKFPLIIYAWALLGGHFLSPFVMKKVYLWPLIGVSSCVLIFSLLTAFKVVSVGAISLSIVSVIGLIVGMLAWSQRRK